MDAFVTGGAGFIGSSMVDRLLMGPHNKVTVYDNFTWGDLGFLPRSQGDGRLRVLEADLLDAATLATAIEGHEVVYHFASNPDIARGMEDPSLDVKQSVVATYNVLEAMRLAGIPRIVFASGSGVYGDVGDTATAEDFGPLLPVSMYGAGKLGAEALISAYCHLYGMKSFILRLANVVGPKQTHGVALDFIRKLQHHPDRLVILGDGCQSKSYIHVDDVLDAIFFLDAMVDEQVNVFNIATADSVDVNWIAQAVFEAMGLSDVVVEYTGGDRGWPGDVPVVRLDTRKIRTLGWQPRYNSQEAVRMSVRQLLLRLGAGVPDLEAR